MKKHKPIKLTPYHEIRVRRTWGMNPAERKHSSPKGKRGYDRKDKGWKKENE